MRSADHPMHMMCANAVRTVMLQMYLQQSPHSMSHNPQYNSRPLDYVPRWLQLTTSRSTVNS